MFIATLEISLSLLKKDSATTDVVDRSISITLEANLYYISDVAVTECKYAHKIR